MDIQGGRVLQCLVPICLILEPLGQGFQVEVKYNNMDRCDLSIPY